jgi:hypothetical protein
LDVGGAVVAIVYVVLVLAHNHEVIFLIEAKVNSLVKFHVIVVGTVDPTEANQVVGCGVGFAHDF